MHRGPLRLSAIPARRQQWTHQAGERQLADQQVGRLLVLANLSERLHAWARPRLRALAPVGAGPRSGHIAAHRLIFAARHCCPAAGQRFSQQRDVSGGHETWKLYLSKRNRVTDQQRVLPLALEQKDIKLPLRVEAASDAPAVVANRRQILEGQALARVRVVAFWAQPCRRRGNSAPDAVRKICVLADQWVTTRRNLLERRKFVVSIRNPVDRCVIWFAARFTVLKASSTLMTPFFHTRTYMVVAAMPGHSRRQSRGSRNPCALAS